MSQIEDNKKNPHRFLGEEWKLKENTETIRDCGINPSLILDSGLLKINTSSLYGDVISCFLTNHRSCTITTDSLV